MKVKRTVSGGGPVGIVSKPSVRNVITSQPSPQRPGLSGSSRGVAGLYVRVGWDGSQVVWADGVGRVAGCMCGWGGTTHDTVSHV